MVGVTIRLFEAGAQLGEASTKGNGAYVFAGLTPGVTYTVREVNPAWLRFSITADESR